MFWCKKASLKRTALFLTSMVLLFVLFSQLAGAAPGNLSISGTKFLDLNSNIIRDKSDPTLPGFIIYIDDNNNTKWDQGENYTRTAENGVYTFLNLSSGIYIIRELVSSGDKFQPSSPQKGYQLVNLTGKSATGVDFGNSMPAAAKASTGSETDSIIPILLAFFAFLLIIAGLIALYRAWSELNSLEPKEDKKTKIQMLIASGFILLFLGLYLAVSLLQLWKNMTGEETIIMGNSFAIVTPVILTLLVLGAVLLMLWVQNRLQEPNETGGMRKTIAGLLVVGLIAIVLFALSGTIKNENQNIITQYIQLVGIVIAFYFGSKATSDAYKGASESNEGDAEKDLDIENIIYDSSGEGSISMDITNKNKRNFILKKISIKEGENELFSYAYPEPGWPVSETQKTYPVGPLPFGSKKNQMDSAIKEANKEYTIALDTSIKQKSVKRTIAKKA
jgi:hypothetical protein